MTRANMQRWDERRRSQPADLGPFEFEVPLVHGLAEGGTWTAAFSSGLPQVTRTSANNTTEYWLVQVPSTLVKPSPIFRGFKPETVKAAYSVNNADSGDDVKFELLKVALPANGSAPSAVTALGGDEDDDYDTAHNTAAKRVVDTGGPEHHTLTVTLDTQAFLATGEGLIVRATVVEANDATGALAVVLKRVIVTGQLRPF